VSSSVRKPTEVHIAIEESVFCAGVAIRGIRRAPRTERHWDGRAVNFLSADSPGCVGCLRMGALRVDFSITSQHQYQLQKGGSACRCAAIKKSNVQSSSPMYAELMSVCFCSTSWDR
jgi:hypothetical protein